MAYSGLKRILAVATAAADVSAITARLTRCGFSVTRAVEAMNVPMALEVRPDVMVVHVRRGRELRAYYASLAAMLHRTPVILVVPDARMFTVNALLCALPLCGYIEHVRDDAELTATITAALDHNHLTL